MTWKIVGASKASVIYIYIYIYIDNVASFGEVKKIVKNFSYIHIKEEFSPCQKKGVPSLYI